MTADMIAVALLPVGGFLIGVNLTVILYEIDKKFRKRSRKNIRLTDE